MEQVLQPPKPGSQSRARIVFVKDPLFSKVLVANRGEIAIRIFRTCHELGIETVAVYSEADSRAPHVWSAGEAYLIGPAPARQSYLVTGNILDAAKLSGAEAVHPGYGFLAENPEFAEAVTDAGLVWIGPPPGPMRLLGDKTAARKMAEANEVPVVPGTDQPVRDLEEAIEAAGNIGYPVLLKAAAGGGGKGMRVVESRGELEDSLKLARSEAGSAFGDESVFIEKYLVRPRHVEFQIMADSHGGCVWLGDRECSVQRRYQKIIEETPSPALDHQLRQRMGAAAVRIAAAADYRGAGTVEFLLEKGEFYFLEVNARLQVEHPVTEMVTGRDLVSDQLRIAAGHPLGYSQEEIEPSGNSIEVRIYAEDPDNNFFPSPGLIDHIEAPSGPGIRHDSGITVGSRVTLHYDPLIAKLVAWAPDRTAMINRINRALEEYQITGVTTIIPFLREILAFEAFQSGEYNTQIVSEMMERRESAGEDMDQSVFLAAVATALFHDSKQSSIAVINRRKSEGRTRESGWVLKGRELREWRK